ASGLSSTSSLLKFLRTFRRRSAFGGFCRYRLSGRGRLCGFFRSRWDWKDLRNREPADLRDLLRPAQGPQAIDCRLEHVDRVRRSEALREDVANAAELEHGANAPARDHASPLARGPQQHPRGSELTQDLMGDRRALLRHGKQVLLGVVDRLRDRERHLARLAVADADPVDLVTDHDEGRERESPPAFDDLGDAVDLDHALLELTLSLTLDHFTFNRSRARHQNLSPPSRAPSASA